MKFYRFSVLSAVVAAMSAFFVGCTEEEPAGGTGDYGYVQFKLYKEASYPVLKSTDMELDYLAEAAKVKVELFDKDEQTISQTLTLTAGDKESAEYGLRSSRLQILAGEYQVVGFVLYDNVDKELTRGTTSGEPLNVVAGGLSMYDLTASVQPRGKVRFYLEKDLSSLPAAVQTRAGEVKREYTMDEIKKIDITVKTADGTADVTAFKNLPVRFSTHFASEDIDGNKVESSEDFGYVTSSSVCDTLVSLEAGEYTIESFTAYDSQKSLLETCVFDAGKAPRFSVADNEVAKAKVRVALHEADGYIRDYYALRSIWEALDGENWYYEGEAAVKGANWDFNKDPDLWGMQPGVNLHGNGRVAKIDLTGFGVKGEIPAAIGDLTELVELHVGSHNEMRESDVDPLSPNAGEEEKQAHRMAVYREFSRLMHPPVQMSAPCALALREHGIKGVDAMSSYASCSDDELAMMAAGRRASNPGISTFDMNFGKLTSGLTGIHPNIGRLKKLEILSIANCPITAAGFPEEMSNLTSCTDLEIYNCPELGKLPDAIGKMPSLVSVNISNNGFGNGSDDDENEAYQAIRKLATGPSRTKIQILYALQNNLRKIPDEISDMKELSMLDLAYNSIHGKVQYFGETFSPIELHLDNNLIEGFEDRNGKTKFCRTEDWDVFSANYNLMTEFPNIFTADTDYYMTSVSIAYNNISSFPEDFKGVVATTLTLSGNDFTSFPKELFGTEGVNSYSEYVLLSGCRISEFPEDCFKSDRSAALMSFDLTWNNLTELPADFNGETFPYLYGVDLSNNNFNHVPSGPANASSLTVYAIRGQRDNNGNRCLTEWPDGLSDHKGLRGFYIGSNDIRKVTDNITSRIYNIDISDNPNITFDAANICAAWKAGLFNFFYDKGQDIINCDEMLQ